MMKLKLVLCVLGVAALSVACSGEDDGVTAENITLEECEMLFGEDAVQGDEVVEGDFDDDGDADEDDTAIEDRCVELMSEEEADAGADSASDSTD